MLNGRSGDDGRSNGGRCDHWCCDNSRSRNSQCQLISSSKRSTASKSIKLLFEQCNMFFRHWRHVRNLVNALCQCRGGCRRRDIVHKHWNYGCVGVTMNPFVDSVFDESSWDILRCVLTVRKDNLAFGILLAFAIVNVCLAYQAITNEMSGKSTKDTKKIFDLVRTECRVHTRGTVRFRTGQCHDKGRCELFNVCI